MDAIGKLLRRVSLKDQVLLLELMREIKDPEKRKLIDIKKLSGGNFYRARKGKFRIIFHIEHDRAVTDSIRFRNEKTYREF